jgi:putative membrane protein
MHAATIWSLLGMALFLGVINTLVRPVLLLLSLPFIVVTLGFFILVINALVFELAGWLVPGFIVGGFWRAFFGSIIVSVVSWALNSFFRGDDGRYYTITRHAEMKRVEGHVVK